MIHKMGIMTAWSSQFWPWGLNELTHAKYLEQCLPQRTETINVSNNYYHNIYTRHSFYLPEKWDSMRAGSLSSSPLSAAHAGQSINSDWINSLTEFLYGRKLKCTSKHSSLNSLQPKESPVPLPGSSSLVCPSHAQAPGGTPPAHCTSFPHHHVLKTLVLFSFSSQENASWEQGPCSLSRNLNTTFLLDPSTMLVRSRCSIIIPEWIK